MFTFEGSNHIGGIARLCSELTGALRHAGHEVIVPLDQVFQGNAAKTLSNRRTPHPGAVVRAAIALRRSAKDSRVICGQWYPDGVVALLAGVRPAVTLGHGSELMPSMAKWRRGLWARLRSWVFHQSQVVVCSSAYSRDLVLHAHPKTRAVAIPLGVDTERFGPGDRDAARGALGIATPYVISSVSRLYRFKGHETVLRALSRIPAEHRAKLTYIVAGTGPDRPFLEAEAARLGLQEQVRWLGFVPDHLLPRVYQASNLFILCTREEASKQEVEGFGLVFLEAQSCGTAVVGTQTGGIPDAIQEGISGWLIEQDDSDALATILGKVVEDPVGMAELGILAREHVLANCTWSVYVDRFVSALDPNHSTSVVNNITRPGDPSPSIRSRDSI